MNTKITENNLQMIFQAELAEEINYTYLVNQIFEVFSPLFAKSMSERMGPTYGILFVCKSFYW